MAADPAAGPSLFKKSSSQANSTHASISLGWSLLGLESGGVPLKEFTIFFRKAPSGTVVTHTLSASDSSKTIE